MAYAEARSIEMGAIPVIDIDGLAEGRGGAVARIAGEMIAAAEATGFFYVRNHGVPAALSDAVFAASRRFFAQEEAAKREVAVNAWHRGFIPQGQAKMSDGARVDLKESFIWGLDTARGLDAPDAHGTPPNRWPALPGMRETLDANFVGCNEVGWQLLRAFATALGIAPDSFVRSIGRPTSRGSLVWYPPQPPDMGAEQFGVAPHTDFGTLTLVNQDMVGGLEVQAQDGGWVTAHPIPGTFVVNVGDLLGRWTNDRFKSTPHRVVNRSGRERFSVAMFVDPDRDTPIVPVTRPGEAARYPEVTCGAYVKSRFDAAFAYRQKGAPA